MVDVVGNRAEDLRVRQRSGGRGGEGVQSSTAERHGDVEFLWRRRQEEEGDDGLDLGVRNGTWLRGEEADGC